MADLRKWKKRGTPGPRKDSDLGSILHETCMLCSPMRLLQHSHSYPNCWRLPLKIRLARRCLYASVWMQNYFKNQGGRQS